MTADDVVTGHVGPKSLATAASNGSTRHLIELLDFCTDAGLNTNILYPVFYSILNSTRIPSIVEDLENSSNFSPDDAPITGALMALHFLSMDITSPLLPLDILPDLWSTMWPWICVIDSYWDSLPALHEWFPSIQLYTDHISLLARLLSEEGTPSLITATPGVRLVIVRAWAVLLENKDCFCDPGFQLVCPLLEGLGVFHPKHLAEVLDGVGTVHELARLVVLHVRRALGPDRQVTENTAHLLRPIFGLLYFQDMKDGGDEDWEASLAVHGVVDALTCVFHAFSISNLSTIGDFMKTCLRHLLHNIFVPPVHCSLSTALDSGILQAIIGCATAAIASGPVVQYLVEFLDRTLCPYTVYYSVLKHMRPALEKARKAASTREFQLSTVFPHWEKFVGAAQLRYRGLEEYELNGITSYDKVCDNVECGALGPRERFRRCSSCQQAYYCSTQCQAVDWNSYGHRSACRTLTPHRHRASEDLTARDLSFMRALAYNDFRSSRCQALALQVQFMQANPDEPYLLVLDYTTGFPTVDVAPMQKLAAFPGAPFRAQLIDRSVRSARGKGRMDVHLLRVKHGLGVTFRVVCLPYATRLQEHLRQIAKNANLSDDEMEAKIKVALMEEEAHRTSVLMG
ncbi:hypothetical protein B0H13DRAFT_2429805 [Mycena leptocephala]|nr:hypothetical protein B0H13DRAFT_2429805 [Mycena leptocephala]